MISGMISLLLAAVSDGQRRNSAGIPGNLNLKHMFGVGSPSSDASDLSSCMRGLHQLKGGSKTVPNRSGTLMLSCYNFHYPVCQYMASTSSLSSFAFLIYVLSSISLLPFFLRYSLIENQREFPLRYECFAFCQSPDLLLHVHSAACNWALNPPTSSFLHRRPPTA